MACAGGPERQKETDLEKEVWRQAQNEWQAYKDIYKPVQAKEIEDVKRLERPEQRRLAVGRAVNSARELVPSTNARTQPSSGGFLRTLSGQTAARTAGLSRAAVAGDAEHTGMIYGRKSRLAQLGRGLAVEGLSGSSRGAQMWSAANAAQNAAAAAQKSGWVGALGNAAGTAFGYWAGGKMFGGTPTGGGAPPPSQTSNWNMAPIGGP